MTHTTRLIGLDWATKADRVGVVTACFDGQHVVIESARALSELARTRGQADAHGIECASALNALAHSSGDVDATLLCVDAPLGWPDAFRSLVGDHDAGNGVPTSFDFDALFRRATDDAVTALTGKRPLEVSANFIGRTAGSVLAMMEHLRQGDADAWPTLQECGSGHFAQGLIEVYPGALLTCLNTPSRGYKKNKKTRRALLDELMLVYDLELGVGVTHGAVIANDHILDALMCVCAGLDFLAGRVHSPPEDLDIQGEGWIWVRPPHTDKEDHG